MSDDPAKEALGRLRAAVDSVTPDSPLSRALYRTLMDEVHKLLDVLEGARTVSANITKEHEDG